MPDDIALKQAFDRAAGVAPNAPAALAGLRTRIRKAHQRRALARGGAGLLGVVAIGGVVMTVGGDGSGTELASTSPGGPDTSALTATTVARTTSTIGSTSSAAPTSVGAPPTGATSTAAISPATPAPTTGAPTVASSLPGTTVFVPTTRAGVGQVEVFASEGGTIVVDYTSDAMTLTSVAANPGWTVAETRAQPEDIEVRFENQDGGDSRIRVRLVNGQPRQEEERQGPGGDGPRDEGPGEDD